MISGYSWLLDWWVTICGPKAFLKQHTVPAPIDFYLVVFPITEKMYIMFAPYCIL